MVDEPVLKMMPRQTSHTISGPLSRHWIKVSAYSSKTQISSLSSPHRRTIRLRKNVLSTNANKGSKENKHLKRAF